jgi:hypothetical protein
MSALHETYEAFLAADRRRRGSALELGHDLRGDRVRWRVCWYEETGELTVEDMDDAGGIHVEDFHAGISGPVRVLAVVASRERLETLLGRWPGVERWRPRTVDRLLELVC